MNPSVRLGVTSARPLLLACAMAMAMTATMTATSAGCGSASSSPDGASPDGASPDGASPDGASPDSASPDSASPDGASPGMCGADVPVGQECNDVQNMETPLTPTCASGTMPAGTGGVIFDGTYILTSQTYYGATTCPTIPLAETITIAGDCTQLVYGDVLSGTGSARFTAQGNAITFSVTCQHSDVDASFIQNASAQTYTATSTTFTLFTQRVAGAGGSTGDVAVFTRR